MTETSYPKRKHLTIIKKNGKEYFKVQYNKTKIGLVVNKTFSNYDDAIELLDACENKFGQSSVKGLIRVEETPISIATYLSRTSVFWRKIPTLRKDNRPLENPWLHYDRDILTNGNKIFKKRAFRFDRATLKKVARTIQGKNIRPIVHLMYKLGLRRQEAVLLTKSQVIEHPTPHIYIQSKNTERIVYMNDRQYRFIKGLIKPDQERLFDYKVMGFDGSYKKIFEDQNLDVKQHDFRKDYISRMIEQIGLSNSILLSQLLGFTTPRAIERLKNVYPESTGKLKNQTELLSQIGHSSSRITAEHYFSLK